MESGSAMISLLQQLPAQGSTYYFKKQLLEMLEVPIVSPNGQVAMIESLTQRESEILEMLSQRLQDKEIAKHLNISPTTVKSHLKNIYQKLDVHNRREAVVQGGKFGLIATVANGF
jgi:LuxR family maltose regulon positive regulatory protein